MGSRMPNLPLIPRMEKTLHHVLQKNIKKIQISTSQQVLGRKRIFPKKYTKMTALAKSIESHFSFGPLEDTLGKLFSDICNHIQMKLEILQSPPPPRARHVNAEATLLNCPRPLYNVVQSTLASPFAGSNSIISSEVTLELATSFAKALPQAARYFLSE